MTSDPRAALSAFVAALETHLEMSAVRRGENDPSVVAAYNKVADAFIGYDDALLEAFGEVTPLDVYDEEDDAEGSDDDEGDDDSDDDDEGDDDSDDDDEGDDDSDEDDEGEGAGAAAEDTSEYLGLDDEEYDVDDTDEGGASEEVTDGAGRA